MRTPTNITADIGTVIIGFTIYDLIYAPWHPRMAEFGLTGDEFGLAKFLYVLVACVLIAGVVFASSLLTQEMIEVQFRQEEVDKITKRPDYVLYLVLLAAAEGLVFWGFGIQPAAVLFLGMLMHDLAQFFIKLAEGRLQKAN